MDDAILAIRFVLPFCRLAEYNQKCIFVLTQFVLVLQNPYGFFVTVGGNSGRFNLLLLFGKQ